MRRQLFLWVVGLTVPPMFTATLVFGCGTSVVQTPPDETAEGGAGGSGGHHVTTSSGHGASATDGGHDALNEYVDPGCPDAGPPIYDYQCDPYNQYNGDCLPDEGCYIYVQYPSEPCGQETYGSVCSPQGWGQQGDPCGSALDCGAGFVCVITGAGTQCVHLCAMEGEDGCPPGFVCEAIDVEGFGGCI